MSSSADHINYAKFTGFNSIAAAVVFAVFYLPLMGWFVKKSFAIPTYVHYVLTLFCTIRVVAFVIRAILAGSESAGENLSLLIADEILFGVGFFGLLYSAYTLVLDLALLSDRPSPNNPILRLTQNRRLFRLTLTVAVALGIASASMTNTTGQPNSAAKPLREASIIIFLVLTILQALQTVYLARLELTEPERYKRTNDSFGTKHGILILVVISLLLLIREAFTTATMTNVNRQNNENLWYPLLALPELLAVMLYSTPGLVPSRDELPTTDMSKRVPMASANTFRSGPGTL